MVHLIIFVEHNYIVSEKIKTITIKLLTVQNYLNIHRHFETSQILQI